jgi:hypothetical protein
MVLILPARMSSTRRRISPAQASSDGPSSRLSIKRSINMPRSWVESVESVRLSPGPSRLAESSAPWQPHLLILLQGAAPGLRWSGEGECRDPWFEVLGFRQVLRCLRMTGRIILAEAVPFQSRGRGAPTSHGREHRHAKEERSHSAACEVVPFHLPQKIKRCLMRSAFI